MLEARAHSSRNLVTNFNDEDDEEPEVLVRALQCAYAATFTPWADALPARVLSSVTHELATSEEAMQGDETPFPTTFGTSLALAPVQAHTGHFAIRREVPCSHHSAVGWVFLVMDARFQPSSSGETFLGKRGPEHPASWAPYQL